MQLYTIGYSCFELTPFIDVLNKYKIKVVVDVRSMPYSRYKPAYNREALENFLNERLIKYLFLGQECGVRVAGTNKFKHGLERIMKLSERGTVALMCAEKDPIDCHRTIFISRELAARGVSIKHILFNGDVEDNAKIQERLLKMFGLDQEEMFKSYDDRVNEAYKRQAEKITASLIPLS